MVDPVFLVIAGLFLVVGVVAAWAHVARPPELDGERWFKLLLASLHRGRSEARGDDAEAWAEQVILTVPYHPAGRDPAGKVGSPETWCAPFPLMDGEEALVEQLARLDTIEARWRYLYVESEEGMAARLTDPADLGESYDLGRWVGQAQGWDRVADWGAGNGDLGTALLKRVEARWVLVSGRSDPIAPSLLEALASELEVGVVERVKAADLASLGDHLEQQSERVIWIGEDTGALACLSLLAERPTLRDQTDAVLALSAPLKGVDDPASPYARARWSDWMGQWFGHGELDTDCVRRTPYMSLQWLDLNQVTAGVAGLPLSEARFPEPKSGPIDMIEVVDLGPLWLSNPPPSDLTAKALVGVISGWVLTHRAS